MKNIAIILPAYNEESTIQKIISNFHNDCPEAEIWIINNASKDSTKKIASETIKNLNINGGIIDENRLGKGNALRLAFNNIDADIYVVCDADCTYFSEDIYKLINPIKSENFDVVIGDRISSGDYAIENKRIVHSFGNKLLQVLINYLFKANLSDTQSGYRALSRRFVKTYPAIAEGFNIETDMTVHALDKRFKIIDVPIKYKDRPEGSFSKLNTLSDGFLVLKTLANIFRHYQPLIFFSYMSLLFIIIGIILGYPVMLERFETGAITRIPRAILASGIEIIAVLLAAIGVILDSISYHNKCIFEREIMMFDMINKEDLILKKDKNLKHD